LLYSYSSETVMEENRSIISGKDIIVVSIQPWYYEIGSNCKNIALEFSKYNRVMYVNIPITRKTYFSAQKNPGIQEHCRIIREKTQNIRQIGPNIWEYYPTTLIESIGGLPFTPLFRLINRLNNRRFARDIKKAIKILHFKDFILFNDNDIYNGFNLKKLTEPSLTIYYMRDFLQGYPFWKKHASILEPAIIGEADLVATNSTFYADYASQFNKNTLYIGQGCKIDLFDSTVAYPIPEEMKNLSGPIIGYTGALDSERLSIDIIELIASNRPDWNIVLVGPEDENFLNSKLHMFSNIYFLGRKPLADLPAYIGAFDVCINPQLINIITRGNYPLKIDEYLAMGKPVVATRTDTMKLFEEFTFLADQPEEYIELIERALMELDPELAFKRSSFARSHTWENSVGRLYEQMKEFFRNTEILTKKKYIF
jgi:teichuronic acid biosynthesis glycosyltransferase TuaH